MTIRSFTNSSPVKQERRVRVVTDGHSCVSIIPGGQGIFMIKVFRESEPNV